MRVAYYNGECRIIDDSCRSETSIAKIRQSEIYMKRTRRRRNHTESYKCHTYTFWNKARYFVAVESWKIITCHVVIFWRKSFTRALSLESVLGGHLARLENMVKKFQKKNRRPVASFIIVIYEKIREKRLCCTTESRSRARYATPFDFVPRGFRPGVERRLVICHLRGDFSNRRGARHVRVGVDIGV